MTLRQRYAIGRLRGKVRDDRTTKTEPNAVGTNAASGTCRQSSARRTIFDYLEDALRGFACLRAFANIACNSNQEKCNF